MTREEAGRFREPGELIMAAHRVLQANDGHHHEANLVLKDLHKGHEIVVTVHYRITVDGHDLETPLTLDEAGIIGSHALPTHAYRSPLNLVKALIDAFQDQKRMPPCP